MEAKKTQINKTFIILQKENYRKEHFGVFGATALKQSFFPFHFILLTTKRGLRCFRDLLKIKRTNIFVPAYSPCHIS